MDDAKVSSLNWVESNATTEVEKRKTGFSGHMSSLSDVSFRCLWGIKLKSLVGKGQ